MQDLDVLGRPNQASTTPKSGRKNRRARPERSKKLRTPAKMNPPACPRQLRRPTHPEPGGERTARKQAEPHPAAQPRATTKPTPPLHTPAGSNPMPRPEDIRSRSRMKVGTQAFSVPDFRPRPLRPARGPSAQTQRFSAPTPRPQNSVSQKAEARRTFPRITRAAPVHNQDSISQYSPGGPRPLHLDRG
uniref:extensin-like n=1 Tax=Myodes glareolus TaxID=447135 RepID=UPI00202241AB|nr:extensin-like [Myodes glareolus]